MPRSVSEALHCAMRINHNSVLLLSQRTPGPKSAYSWGGQRRRSRTGTTNLRPRFAPVAPWPPPPPPTPRAPRALAARRPADALRVSDEPAGLIRGPEIEQEDRKIGRSEHARGLGFAAFGAGDGEASGLRRARRVDAGPEIEQEDQRSEGERSEGIGGSPRLRRVREPPRVMERRHGLGGGSANPNLLLAFCPCDLRAKIRDSRRADSTPWTRRVTRRGRQREPPNLLLAFCPSDLPAKIRYSHECDSTPRTRRLTSGERQRDLERSEPGRGERCGVNRCGVNRGGGEPVRSGGRAGSGTASLAKP